MDETKKSRARTRELHGPAAACTASTRNPAARMHRCRPAGPGRAGWEEFFGGGEKDVLLVYVDQTKYFENNKFNGYPY